MAKKILVLGAGKSSGVLIDYLSEHSKENDWRITVADQNPIEVETKISGKANTAFIQFDVNDQDLVDSLVKQNDLVISMLPARFHIFVAKTCLLFKKNLITPSYVSAGMQELDEEVKKAGLLFLNELGVDPGIDHMSAMKVLDRLRAEGAEIVGFESFTGGLVAPESDDNPWGYKFTWNPRNVVLAGQGAGGIKFLHNGQHKYIPYHRLFERTEIINIDGYGEFEGYANRDSLKYQDDYQLGNVVTMYRGTLRRPGFCSAWNCFVQLGMTDDTYYVEGAKGMSYRAFTNSFLKYTIGESVEEKICTYLGIDMESGEMSRLQYLNLFSEDHKLELDRATPAQALQHILERKWGMNDGDKDMIVMWHKFNYVPKGGGPEQEINASMIAIGEDEERTAMAKTVGMPVAIAAEMILQDEIDLIGVQKPLASSIYEPILEKLKAFEIDFVEKEFEATLTRSAYPE